MINNIDELKKNLAIVILAYSDYESLEISLALHSKFLPYKTNDNERVKIFILQNGRNTYDCERTLEVAKRYRDLNPYDIEVVTDINPGIPYFSLRELFRSERFKKFKYIIKLDDDVFPITPNWLDQLCQCFIDSKKKYNDNLAYVTSLVNNNPYGFGKILDLLKLREEFNSTYAREHIVGIKNLPQKYSPYRILNKGEISTGGAGTIWGCPYISRWIHKKTTLTPSSFAKACANLGYSEVNNKERYSINCQLFEKELWDTIYDGESSDEFMWQKYCYHNNKKIIANLAVPMIHLFFFTQRFENKDLLPKIREVYTEYTSLPFPISLCSNKELELERRLQFIENKINKQNSSPFTRLKISIKKRLQKIKTKLKIKN